MKRRAFLKFLGGAALASVAAKEALDRSFAALQGRGRPFPEVEGETALRMAIEALFPAGSIHGATTSWAEFDRKNRMLLPGDDHRHAVTRVIFETFALGYLVEDEGDGKLHRGLYRSMYRTWEMIAERPENRNAILVWRLEPKEIRETRSVADGGEDVVSVRLRAALLQQGWRRRLNIAAWMIGAKPQGEPIEMLPF